MKQTWKLHLNLNLHQNRNQEPQWNWNGHPNLNLTKSHEIVAILDQAVLVQDVCHANLVLCAGCVEMEWVTNHFYQVLLQVNSFRFGVSFRFSLCFRFSPSFSPFFFLLFSFFVLLLFTSSFDHFRFFAHFSCLLFLVYGSKKTLNKMNTRQQEAATKTQQHIKQKHWMWNAEHHKQNAKTKTN